MQARYYITRKILKRGSGSSPLFSPPIGQPKAGQVDTPSPVPYIVRDLFQSDEDLSNIMSVVLVGSGGGVILEEVDDDNGGTL